MREIPSVDYYSCLVHATERFAKGPGSKRARGAPEESAPLVQQIPYKDNLLVTDSDEEAPERRSRENKGLLKPERGLCMFHLKPR